MTDERDDLFEIFDKITNNHELWDVIEFKKIGDYLYKIKGIDKYGTVYNWSEQNR